ncbi:8-oxoguanine glycosylase ogg1, partial [Podochytrium sp. JEL0797]
MISAIPPWHTLCPTSTLNLTTTLFNGQSFSWRKVSPTCFSNVLASTLITLKQTPTSVLFRIESPDTSRTLNQVRADLESYFLLHVDADALFAQWNAVDPTFLKRTRHLAGTRLLRQPPVECCFSFICSANNNISRITQMVGNLKRTYGKSVGSVSREGLEEGEVDSGEWEEQQFFTFPEPEDMCGRGVEKELRELGFGYRAGYIARTAGMLSEKEGGSSEWLHGLRGVEYAEAKGLLLELMGVGPKVADCILLMSLDKFDAIPVDTHVWRIAKRDYGLHSSAVTKSLNAKMYEAIGDKWREIFGEFAGWAQSLLFSAEIQVGKGVKGKRGLEVDEGVGEGGEVKMEGGMDSAVVEKRVAELTQEDLNFRVVKEEAGGDILKLENGKFESEAVVVQVRKRRTIR